VYGNKGVGVERFDISYARRMGALMESDKDISERSWEAIVKGIDVLRIQHLQITSQFIATSAYLV
jgi:hypothetical protein